MGKVLFLVLIGVVVWLLFFAKRSMSIKREKPPATLSERMLLCNRCGVHIPASEACAIAGTTGKYSCADPERCGNRVS
jgi:hypothetical protein